jgi:hypothetical protein
MLYQNAKREEWERLALEELAATDARWNNVPGAQALYQRLGAQVRKRIDAAWSLRRDKWQTLLTNIARDQLAYDQIIKGQRRYKELAAVAERFGRSESWARQVYARYSAQASILRGDGPLVPSAERRQSWKERGGLDVVGRRVRTRSEIPAGLTEGKTGKALRAVQDHWIEHWFAHALRNLVQYRDNHRPLPWPGPDSPPGTSKTCKETCLRERDRRARED